MMTDQQTIKQMATRAYERTKLYEGAGYGKRWIEYELREAEHQGWLRGHAEGCKQMRAINRRYEPLIFMMGYALGALLMVVVTLY